MKKLIQEWKELKRKDKYIKISLREWLVNFMIGYKLGSSIENLFYPIKIGEDLVQFTNYVLIGNGSGDSYYLVKVDNRYQIFKIWYEVDCDGCYYGGSLIPLMDCLQYIDEFRIEYNYTNKLLKNLQNLYL